MKKRSSSSHPPTENEAHAEQRLAGALKGRGGALTRADAIALTGLSELATDTALKRMLTRYRSHLAVTDQGELLYQFDPSLARRDAPTIAERLAAVGRLAFRGFKFSFKVWIVVTLVFYVIAFAAMAIALLFAQSASDRDDRRSDRGGFGVSPWLLYWLMPDWAPVGYGSGMHRSYGRRLDGRDAQRPRKRFYQAAFDFVFGPAGPPRDPLGFDKAFVAYARDHAGRVTATDLVALTGWSYERAEEEATRLLGRYDGDPEIDEDGTLVYAFPSLLKTAGEVRSDTDWTYARRRRREPPPLTGNTSAANAVLVGMNGFNLVAAFVVGPAFLARFGVDDESARVVVQYFPLVFSAIFFAVPAGRAVLHWGAERRLVRESARAALVGEILARRGDAVTPRELREVAVRRSGLAADQVDRLLTKLLVDIDGDVATDDAGNMIYRFPRVTEELQSADRARRLAPAEQERAAGQVEFSSEAPGSGALPP